jgi:hypothetical protein
MRSSRSVEAKNSVRVAATNRVRASAEFIADAVTQNCRDRDQPDKQANVENILTGKEPASITMLSPGIKSPGTPGIPGTM